MKKFTYLSVIFIFGLVLFSSCGETRIALDEAISKGNFYVKKGMSKKKVLEIINVEPTTVERIGDYELWIYEGVFNNPDLNIRKYKNLVIKFKNDKVIYTAYFNCKLPKVED
ncbi:MAG: hypothetical protein DSY59_05515 [Persephonella sp.]|nr:MAG: hypothetical protein DSY59_05515 [Persephonella sp.]